jgi:tripartite ATP-independent transporter DctP family solute receptor
MLTSKILRSCALLVGITLALPAIARDFRAAETQVPDYPTVQGLNQMAKLLDERSKGRLKIKVFANSALGSERDTIEQLKIGGLDMLRLSIAPLNNIVPETIVPSLPFVFRNEEHMHAALDGPVGEEILAAMAKQGIIGLAWYDDGPRSIYAKKPIKSLADMKGLKLRVQQSDLWVAMTEALGASPTPLPYGEVYTALTTGIIDAAENSVLSYDTSRHFEVAKNFSLTEHSLLPSVVVFSKMIWDRLPEADRELIRQAAKDSVPYQRKLAQERQAQARETLVGKGVQFVPVENRAEFVKAMTPVYDKFATTPELKSMIKRIEETK